MCREVALLKINVERAEWDVLAGISDADWPKVRRPFVLLVAVEMEVASPGLAGRDALTHVQPLPCSRSSNLG